MSWKKEVCENCKLIVNLPLALCLYAYLLKTKTSQLSSTLVIEPCCSKKCCYQEIKINKDICDCCVCKKRRTERRKVHREKCRKNQCPTKVECCEEEKEINQCEQRNSYNVTFSQSNTGVNSESDKCKQRDEKVNHFKWKFYEKIDTFISNTKKRYNEQSAYSTDYISKVKQYLQVPLTKLNKDCDESKNQRKTGIETTIDENNKNVECKKQCECVESNDDCGNISEIREDDLLKCDLKTKEKNIKCNEKNVKTDKKSQEKCVLQVIECDKKEKKKLKEEAKKIDECKQKDKKCKTKPNSVGMICIENIGEESKLKECKDCVVQYKPVKCNKNKIKKSKNDKTSLECKQISQNTSNKNNYNKLDCTKRSNESSDEGWTANSSKENAVHCKPPMCNIKEKKEKKNLKNNICNDGFTDDCSKQNKAQKCKTVKFKKKRISECLLTDGCKQTCVQGTVCPGPSVKCPCENCQYSHGTMDKTSHADYCINNKGPYSNCCYCCHLTTLNQPAKKKKSMFWKALRNKIKKKPNNSCCFNRVTQDEPACDKHTNNIMNLSCNCPDGCNKFSLKRKCNFNPKKSLDKHYLNNNYSNFCSERQVDNCCSGNYNSCKNIYSCSSSYDCMNNSDNPDQNHSSDKNHCKFLPSQDLNIFEKIKMMRNNFIVNRYHRENRSGVFSLFY